MELYVIVKVKGSNDSTDSRRDPVVMRKFNITFQALHIADRTKAFEDWISQIHIKKGENLRELRNGDVPLTLTENFKNYIMNIRAMFTSNVVITH